VLVDELPAFAIHGVLVGGEHVVESGDFCAELPAVEYPPSFYRSVSLPAPLSADDLTLRLADKSDQDALEVRVIGVTDGSLVTDERRIDLPIVDGALRADLDRDVLPLAMVDRFGKGTGIGLGFAQGFGLRRGAFASTANAQCENIVVVGIDPADMALAANHVAEIGGGKAVVADGEVLAQVGLPLLGLHAEGSLEEVMEEFDSALAALTELGCRLASPFSQLEFSFACGALGDIKLSEEGLLLIHPPQHVDLVVGPARGQANGVSLGAAS
jgi:adenine deaminase